VLTLQNAISKRERCGATYFITANLADRTSTALTNHIDVLRDALRRAKASHPFDIEAMVVLSDHFHLLMTLPPDDANFSLRVGAIKSAFSRQHVLPNPNYQRSLVRLYPFSFTTTGEKLCPSHV
jgi:putative transposase